MPKEVYYNFRYKSYYVREKGTTIDGIEWGKCPYNESEEEKIEQLEKSYTNALNATEWQAEGKAKQAFLAAGDLLSTFFATKDAAKKELIGDIAGEAGGVMVNQFFSRFKHIADNLPEELTGNFISHVKAKEAESPRIMESSHRVSQAKKTIKAFNGVKSINDLKKGLQDEKTLVGKIRKGNEDLTGKLENKISDNDDKLKEMGEGAKEALEDFIGDYFAIWALAIEAIYS